jgi:DNA invertase Pin-like site-specific DNA recombinase
MGPPTLNPAGQKSEHHRLALKVPASGPVLRPAFGPVLCTSQKFRILEKCPFYNYFFNAYVYATLLFIASFRGVKLIIAYARVSTNSQSNHDQIVTLKKAGAGRIFAEKMSGTRGDRPQLRRALAALGEGDVLMVTRLDRLARSTRDLLNTLDQVAKKGARFKSLGDPWCDSTSPHGKLMLTILGGLAEFERSLIVARTSEGRARAKALGVRFGRKLKLDAFQRDEAIKLLDKGLTQSHIAKFLKVDQSTISRLAAREAAE